MLDSWTRLFLHHVAQTLFKYATVINRYLSTQTRSEHSPELTESTETPPAHWLEKVKRGAPHLLEQHDYNFDSRSTVQSYTLTEDTPPPPVTKELKRPKPNNQKTDSNKTAGIVNKTPAKLALTQHNLASTEKQNSGFSLNNHLHFFKGQTLNTKPKPPLKTTKNKIADESTQPAQQYSSDQGAVSHIDQPNIQTDNETSEPLKTSLNIKPKITSSKTSNHPYKKKPTRNIQFTDKTVYHLYSKPYLNNHQSAIPENNKSTQQAVVNDNQSVITEIQTVATDTALVTKNSELYFSHPLKQKPVIQQAPNKKIVSPRQHQKNDHAHPESLQQSAITKRPQSNLNPTENLIFSEVTADHWPPLPEQHELQTEHDTNLIQQQFWQLHQQAKFDCLRDLEQRGTSWNE